MQLDSVLKIKKHNLNIGLLYFFYRILLDFVYIIWVSPIYGYVGFSKDLDVVNVIVSYLVILFFVYYIPKGNSKVSHLIIQLHFIIMIIPLTSVYSMGNLSTKFILMILAGFGLQVFLVKNLPAIKIGKIRNAKRFVLSILTLLTLITYLYLLLTQNINLKAFDISRIYEIRSEQIVSSPLMSYLITWQYRVVNPTILVLSYLNRSYKLGFLAIGLQLLLYLMFPHKEVFLSIGLIILTLFIAHKKYKFDSFFVYFLSILGLAFIGIYELFRNIIPFFIFLIRLLYLPALTKFWHYDFFLENKKLYFSEGIIGKLLGIDYPYTVPSGFLIKDGRMGNANTGYLAYAYDNLGVLGIIIISVIFVYLLITVDSLAKNGDGNVIMALFVYPMIVLNDTDLFTSLLTGGLFLLIIILLVFSDDTKSKKTEEKKRNNE